MIFRSILIRLFVIAFFAGFVVWLIQPETARAGTPGSLDQSFNGVGFAATAMGRQFAEGFDTVVQPDGKIVVAGRRSTWYEKEDALVARYNSDGSLDAAFGDYGKAAVGLTGLDVSFTSVALQPDGKIVAVGGAYAIPNFYMFIARFTNSGQLDTSFNLTGYLKLSLSPYHGDNASGVKVQSDGKIVVGGTSYRLTSNDNYNYDLTVLRLNQDGQLDASFNGTGYSFAHVTDGQDTPGKLVLQPDGKIVLVGSGKVADNTDFIAARFNIDGSLDSAFNGTGFVVTPVGTGDDAAHGVAVQPDGKIMVVGDATDSVSHMALVRYNADGSLDTAFNGTGKLISPVGETSNGWNLVVQTDGKIVAVGQRKEGTHYDLLVSRYHDDGSVDPSFNGTGYSTPSIQNTSQAYAVTMQVDGKILIAGNSYRSVAGVLYEDLMIARYWATPSSTSFDYDGDGKTDISVFRPSIGQWYILKSQLGLYGVSFGANEDKLAPADYDGDGKTDVAVYRPSNGVWYVMNSATGTVSYHVFGTAEDLPTPADYDGDGKADLSVFRPSTGTWYRLNSHDGSFFGYQFGQTGDKPASGDFDGDGKADISIFRPSTGSWYRVNSSTGQVAGTQFGAVGDLITPADYDGDGKTDIAVFRPSVAAWYRLNSSDGSFAAVSFGAANDIPAPGDYDGDGKADVNVFRPSDGNWYRLNSSNNAFVAQPFGANGDLPTPAAFRY